jgi:RNA polymerase sigma factor (sigma-70 family)
VASTDLARRLRSPEEKVRHQAQTELYELCRTQLVPYFRRRLRYTDEVEDHVHEVFAKALETIQRGNDPRNVAAWLTGIAHNLCKAHYEHLKNRADGEIPERPSARAEVLDLAADEWPELPEDFEEILGKRELWHTVRVAITAIPPGLRRVISTHITLDLREQRRIPTAELASALDMPPTSVERQLHRARQATITAATALTLARSHRPDACGMLDQLLTDILTDEQ